MVVTVPHSGVPGGVTLLQRGAVVPRDVHQAVVAPGPDDARLERRFGNREDRAVELDPGVVAGDRPARPFLFALVVARQVGADGLPGLTAVRGSEEHVGGVVDRLGIVRRDHDGGGPLEAVAKVLRTVARSVVGVDPDVRSLTGSSVVTREVAEVLAGPDDLRVGGVGDHVAGLTPADAVPVAERWIPPPWRLLLGAETVPKSWRLPSTR